MGQLKSATLAYYIDGTRYPFSLGLDGGHQLLSDFQKEVDYQGLVYCLDLKNIYSSGMGGVVARLNK